MPDNKQNKILDKKQVVAVIGAGADIGAAIVREFANAGFVVCAGRRNGDELKPLGEEIKQNGGEFYGYSLDARDEDKVTEFFEHIENDIGELAVTVFNVGANVPMSILETSSRKFYKIWQMACFAGFLAGRESAKHMLKRNRGTIIFTGATASVRGASGFAAFSSAKQGLRALAQSMARELQPQNIHVAHIIIDAAVDTQFIRGLYGDALKDMDDDAIVKPKELAKNYLMLHEQARSAWTFELDIRPFSEKW